MGLRTQILRIAERRINPAFAATIDWPTIVDTLARNAFIEEWEDGADVRAIRRAAGLLHGRPGWVTEDEPEVL